MTADVISDQELISLYEERIPHSSIKYDDVLKKAVFLLKDKTRIEVKLINFGYYGRVVSLENA